MAALTSLLPTCQSFAAISSASSSNHTALPAIAIRKRQQVRRISKSVVVRASAEVEEETAKPAAGVLDAANPALEEKFAVLDTGRWECRSCGFVYDQAAGDPSYPVSSGTEFKNLPEDWRCPTCGAAQTLFQSKSREVAGFAQNQSYGLGANTLTSGQKSLLIYGSLLFFFALFLSGYLLQ